MEYQLRRHPRARRIKLRIDRHGRVDVTAPRGVSRTSVDRWVRNQAEWIERHRAALHAGLDPATDGPRPRRLELAAVDETWRVDYGETARTRARGDTLIVDTRLAEDTIRQRLLDWLRGRARTGLEPRLGKLAADHGLAFGRVGWRNQTSRWGSCSARGDLSLNLRLLFLPPRLADHVLVHELCHTEHPDHGAGFWRRVAGIDPDWRTHRRQLRAAWARLPAWLDA